MKGSQTTLDLWTVEYDIPCETCEEDCRKCIQPGRIDVFSPAGRPVISYAGRLSMRRVNRVIREVIANPSLEALTLY